MGWLLTLLISKARTSSAPCVYLCVKAINIMGKKNVSNGKRKTENEETAEEQPKKQKLQQQGHWANGLLSAMDDDNLKVQDDDLVVVIKDKYPKAEYHYLVMPKTDIASLEALNKTHLELLKHMHKVGIQLAKDQPDREFKIGFHARASMKQLHLHVISDDFNSPSLKTKKHWNSYTTEFFLPFEAVLSQIKKTGNFSQMPEGESNQILKRDLKCHKCAFGSKTIPTLKNHVQVTHFSTAKNNHKIFDN